MMPTRIVGGPALVMVAVTMYLTFSFASVTGASVAVNETRTYDEYREDVATIVDDAHADVDANLTGSERVVEPLYDGIFHSADAAVEAGFDFGYRSPDVAVWNAKAAPYLSIGGLVVFIVHKIRGLRP